MSNHIWQRRWTLIKWTIPILILVGLGITVYAATAAGRVTDQELLLIAQDRLTPGTHAALRAIVRDVHSSQPVPDATITVRIQPIDGGKSRTLYQGQTDATGTAPIAFTVPDDVGEQARLIVEARSRLGHDRVERTVRLERAYRLLLTTDKPLYQPGQVIHVRLLALRALDMAAADGQPVEVVIEDPKGNKVHRQTVTTSAFGVGSLDFHLANEVNTGPYKITAKLGNARSERTVTVKPYVLPKFRVSLETEKRFYRPGERVRGSISAKYFFGKPVAAGEVMIRGYRYVIEQEKVLELHGETDAEGRFEFEFEVPSYFIASALEAGQATLGLEVTVVDQAEHAEQAAATLPIAADPILIDAVPESGHLKPEVENILYILTSYPDGTPAETTLAVEVYGQRHELKTGRYGLAEFRFTPRREPTTLTVSANDAQGSRAQRSIELPFDWAPEYVLLRTDRAAYRVGETMQVDVLASAGRGTAYLDIIKEGQTLSTQALDVVDGHGSTVIDLTPDLFGTLELHAYKVLRDGTIVRDTRLVVVDTARDVDLRITTDRGTYRPGETATVRFQTTQDGKPVVAAIGVTAVDESVFALQEAEAGFAKLYFLLRQELLEPRYDIHGLSWSNVLSETVPPAREGDAPVRASLSKAVQTVSDVRPVINSHREKIQAVRKQQRRLFGYLADGFGAVIPPTGLVLVLAVIVSLVQRRQLGRALKLLLGILFIFGLVLFIIVLLLPAPPWRPEAGLGDRIGYALNSLSFYGEPLLIILGGLALIAWGAAVVDAWRRRDDLLQVALLLLLMALLALVGFGFAASQGRWQPTAIRLVPLLLTLPLLPLALLLLGADYGVRRRLLPAVSATFLGLLLLLPLGAFPVAAVAMLGGGMAAPAAPPVPMEAAARRQEARLGMPRPIPTVLVEKVVEAAPAQAASAAAQEPPRLRQFFPETLFVEPELLTDDQGQAELQIPLADSITTWRLSALASTQAGALGNNTLGIRVFQDFFVDLDLPLALTQNDEVAVPVAVYNYLPRPQKVRLELTQEAWFELASPEASAVQEITIAANDVDVVYFRIRALQFGTHRLTVTAWGKTMSDAIAKDVKVLPDGKPIRETISDRLEGRAEQVVHIPQGAIPGTARIWVKIYPGVVSQVVEGLEGMLRMPMGCFEQTSSLTYPNVLVLDYLKRTDQLVPEVQLKAEEYIALGYQRLLTFEVPGHGFSLFGNPPANVVLSSYGLMEFSDMARVHEVDPDLIERTARWLMDQQQSNGTWKDTAGFVHEATWGKLGNKELPITGYVVWALGEAGYGDDPATQRGLDYLRTHWQEAEDPYLLALVANALAANDPQGSATKAVLARLDGMKTVDGDTVYWQNQVASVMGAEGHTGSLETTALAAYAFLVADVYPETAQGALNYLIANKDSFGSWHTTQATILALKSLLLAAAKAGGEEIEAMVQVSLNGGQAEPIQITPENRGVVHLVSFDDVVAPGENRLLISVEGKGQLMYQVTSQYYIPWDLVPDIAPPPQLMTIDVHYDRTELEVNDEVRVDVKVVLNAAGAMAQSALIDLGIPPGFSVMSEDLDRLVEAEHIARYELTGRQILVYLEKLKGGEPVRISYRLRARFPLKAKTPASSAYDYYNPDTRGEQPPQVLVVR
ncbi:MAG TPA: hypothetical protein EYH31_10500 [Anaerolineae bacterium]|nr:hypothetical protein [Anaerolineae bacterium]